MSRRSLLLAPACALAIAIAAPAGAQSMPAMSTAKDAARRAAAATNAHIQAMQNVDGPTTPKPATHARVPAPATHVAELPRSSGSDAKSATPATAKRVGATAASKGSASKAAKTGATPSAGKHPAGHGATPHDTVTVAPQGAGTEGSTSVAERGGKNELSLMRESFTYDPAGRRDPFVSLIASGELRPMISDLRLTAVVFDPGGRSVAVLRDVSTKEQYRIRAGETLGRMRVARIDPKSVTFTLEEFGYSRQETLALNDSTRARSQ